MDMEEAMCEASVFAMEFEDQDPRDSVPTDLCNSGEASQKAHSTDSTVCTRSDSDRLIRKLRYNCHMPTTLPPDVRQFVDDAIASGEYHSEDEVLVSAVRVLRELTERHEALRRDIQQAVASLDRGQGTPLQMDEIKSELASRWEKRRPAS
jgi:putative addiction module CopG family antidote